MSKLTDDDRYEALRRLRSGETQASVARRFGVTAASISNLAKRHPSAASRGPDAGQPCEMPEMAPPAPRSADTHTTRAREPTEPPYEIGLLDSLPDDGIASNHGLGLMRLSQVVNARLT